MQNALTTTSKNSVLYKASKIFSGFFNPLTSLLLYFIYYSSMHYTFAEAVNRFLPILLILILPVSIWIIWNVKKGNYSNMDVSDRKQRKSLYMVIGVLMLIYLVVYGWIKDRADFTMLFIFVLLILMQVSNFFIKSSMHTAFNVLTAGFFFQENVWLGLIWFGISVVVGATRIILKRHTFAEVMTGAVLATIVSLGYIFFTD